MISFTCKHGDASGWCHHCDKARIEELKASLAQEHKDHLHCADKVVELDAELKATQQASDQHCRDAVKLDGKVKELEAEIKAGRTETAKLFFEKEKYKEKAGELEASLKLKEHECQEIIRRCSDVERRLEIAREALLRTERTSIDPITRDAAKTALREMK